MNSAVACPTGLGFRVNDHITVNSTKPSSANSYN